MANGQTQDAQHWTDETESQSGGGVQCLPCMATWGLHSETGEQPGVVEGRLCGIKAVVPPDSPGGCNWLNDLGIRGTAPCPLHKPLFS